ncbi:MAG TPA: hypothetical protein VHO94_04350 [Oscillospiraceae bacterium]|nr:hypothetical protein [Oscillospiraceae bacterium]
MGMKVEANSSKKILQVTLDGFVSTDAAAKVLGEYNQIVGEVNPREYSLLIDCTNMGVFQTDAIETLAKLYKLYMSTGFKHIVFIRAKSAIQNMQLDKAAKMVPGFTGVFVTNMDEALKSCM